MRLAVPIGSKVRLAFWRRECETRTKHRNPCFDASIGFTIAIFVIDSLHSLYLGPVKEFIMDAFWEIIICNAFMLSGDRTQDEIENLSCIIIKSKLMAWYSRQRRLGVKIITELQDFGINFLGKRNQRCLRTKAAETKYLFYFLCTLYNDLHVGLPRCDVWSECALALEKFLLIIDWGPALLPPNLLTEMHDHWMRFATLHGHLGLNVKYKHHAMLHLIHDAAEFGNPRDTAAFLDESLNRTLARVGRACHSAQFELRVLNTYGVAYEDVPKNVKQAKRKRRMFNAKRLADTR